MQDRISLDRVDELFRAIFAQLKAVGGRARPKEIFAAIEPRLNLTDYEKQLNKSGSVRWETLARWYSVDCGKAGFLQKSGGSWILTEQGERAMKLPKGEMIRAANKQYRVWKSAQISGTEEAAIVEVDKPSEVVTRAVYEQAVETARAEIDEHITNLGPYEFQDLVAELLRAMGYHVPLVATRGPDGGVDIVAYRDPLGTVPPRIKVQVKHREQKVSAKEIREMEGLLRKEGDIGLIVSSGGFTPDSLREIRSSTRHIETMDLDRLVVLWQEHYNKLRETGRALLPLVNIFFLAPKEE
jgi:restriction system protein